jgi:hypothetical protein
MPRLKVSTAAGVVEVQVRTVAEAVELLARLGATSTDPTDPGDDEGASENTDENGITHDEEEGQEELARIRPVTNHPRRLPPHLRARLTSRERAVRAIRALLLLHASPTGFIASDSLTTALRLGGARGLGGVRSILARLLKDHSFGHSIDAVVVTERRGDESRWVACDLIGDAHAYLRHYFPAEAAEAEAGIRGGTR